MELGLKFKLELTWNENRLDLRIPLDGIKEMNAAFRLAAIELAPSWGAVTGKEPGYLLLPAGSGTICRFDKTKRTQCQFLLFGRSFPATMPIFGAVHGAAAFLGIVTGGEFDTELVVAAGPEANSVHPAVPLPRAARRRD